MLHCAACAGRVPEGSRFCPACATPVGPASQDQTRSHSPAAVSRSPASPEGDPARDVRFLPGAVVAGRYRIHGQLGRGGMGEVYRADDLKLGQPVALKFLPQHLERDAGRRERFLGEVRLARQIAHPGVCRVFDVGEVDGQHYLSMEYVDGEDLASLLRRIGRLPGDKALQIARQLCAGLAAAHDQGILHRDLKPSNVMIDGRGRARITDFGLAALAEGVTGAELRAGTPGYMAPEQMAGRSVSVRSDLYSLGLVLYELFTGARPFEATTLGELARLQERSLPTTPSSLVPELDPAVERAILRCLEPEPGERPGSALAVAAALPGGDPLAAALMAGETPSPDVVAAAGPAGGLRPGVALACLFAALAALAIPLVSGDSTLVSGLPLDKSYGALKGDASEIAQRLGYVDRPRDAAAWFRFDPVEFRHVVREGAGDWSVAKLPSQTLVTLIYRQDDDPLVPLNLGGNLWSSDPTPSPGDLTMVLDLRGRLQSLRVTPQRVERSTDEPSAPRWPELFEAAGLDLSRFEPVPATFQPAAYADARAAWTGVLPDGADRPVRIEAATLRGKPVFFERITPADPAWSAESPERLDPQGWVRWALPLFVLTLLALLTLGCVLLALRNLRLGRGDRRGALRIAVVVFALRMLQWLLAAHHVAGLEEVFLLGVALSSAISLGVVAWLLYMAIEPYVRRLWPQAIVSWSRLLAGRWRDPLVGRDLLIGFALSSLFGLAATAVWRMAYEKGSLPPLPELAPLAVLGGGRFAAGALVGALLGATSASLGLLALFLLLRIVCRRTWIAVVALLLLLATNTLLQLTALGVSSGSALAVGALLGLANGAFFAVAIRFGLLALIGGLVFGVVQAKYLFTLDPTSPFLGTVLFGVASLVVLAGFAFHTSLAGQPLFRDAILGERGASRAA